MIQRIVFALFVLVAATFCTSAHAQSGKIEVADPWARATIGKSPNTTAYMKLTNRGTEPDRLVDISTTAAGKAELHATIRDGDVMRMREMKGIDLKPGESIVLSPGGTHVMLLDAERLEAGKTFTLTLQFEKAGRQDVTVEVRQQGPMRGGHRQMQGDHQHQH